MHEPIIHPHLVRYAAQYREAELELEWRNRRDLAPPRGRRLPAIDWTALRVIVQGWLFPAPPFGADRRLQIEAVPHRIR